MVPAVLPHFSPAAFQRLAEANEAASGLSAPLGRTGPLFDPHGGAGAHHARQSAEALADDESFWEPIQRAFEVDRSYINLNNGGVSPTPTHVIEQMIRDIHFSNEMPTIHMWQTLDPRIESARRELAIEFGCDPEEMAIVRNASEALETLIFGIDLKAGDESELSAHADVVASTGPSRRHCGEGNFVSGAPSECAGRRRPIRRRHHAAYACHRSHAHHESYGTDSSGA